MTANIQQQVTPRSSRPLSTRGIPKQFALRARKAHTQRGSINSTTITIAVSLTAIAALAVLGFVYLGQVLGTAQQGGDIQALEEQIINLNEKQRELELEGARLRSIETIESEIKELNLVGAGKVTYLQTSPDRVAAAQ